METPGVRNPERRFNRHPWQGDYRAYSQSRVTNEMEYPLLTLHPGFDCGSPHKIIQLKKLGPIATRHSGLGEVLSFGMGSLRVQVLTRRKIPMCFAQNFVPVPKPQACPVPKNLVPPLALAGHILKAQDAEHLFPPRPEKTARSYGVHGPRNRPWLVGESCPCWGYYCLNRQWLFFPCTLPQKSATVTAKTATWTSIHRLEFLQEEERTVIGDALCPTCQEIISHNQHGTITASLKRTILQRWTGTQAPQKGKRSVLDPHVEHPLKLKREAKNRFTGPDRSETLPRVSPLFAQKGKQAPECKEWLIQLGR